LTFFFLAIGPASRLKLPLVKKVALEDGAILEDEAAPCVFGYLLGGAGGLTGPLCRLVTEQTGGIAAFHGYQPFAPGEVTPEQAHEIGMELSKKLWGNRFQVVVATHLDKEHIHNHLVLNSVSFVDGKKYNDCKSTYAFMQQTSDQLRWEHGLSGGVEVINTRAGP